MSNYVLSDVHAHYRTLYRLLEKVGPLSSDRIWVLGDMVDYGPNPVAVMRLLKGLPHCTVLLGDHEDMMLDCFMHPHDEGKRMRWMLDGGATTLDALRSLPTNTAFDLIDWVKGLPLTAYAITYRRIFLLVHAGLRSLNFNARSHWTKATAAALLRYQPRDDLLHLTDEFWGRPTGFVDERGDGPVVVAGHTPTDLVERYAERCDHPARNEWGQLQVLHLGATPATGNIADRWAIDCGAQGGAGYGRLAIVRLEDGREYYEPVLEGD